MTPTIGSKRNSADECLALSKRAIIKAGTLTKDARFLFIYLASTSATKAK